MIHVGPIDVFFLLIKMKNGESLKISLSKLVGQPVEVVGVLAVKSLEMFGVDACFE